MRKMILLAIVIGLAVAPASAARGSKGQWEIGPYAGFAWLDDYDNGNPDNDFLYGARVGYFLSDHWSAELSYQKLSSEIDVPGGSQDFDISSWRLNGLYNFASKSNLRWHVTAGLGREDTESGSFDSTDTSWNAGGGLRWFFTDNFALRWDARYVSTAVGETLLERESNIESTIGVGWFFGGSKPMDSDGDGVMDRRDKCPNTPKGAKVDANGCPTDSDKDGVYDGIDKCDDTPKGYAVDDRGCPRDSDGDGVVDGADKCPNTPKGAKVDATGCPTDADGDGVPDGIDRCPNTPKGVKVDTSGCPVDSDGDGVVDGTDKCPNTPLGAKVDKDGCPVKEEPPKAAPLFQEGKKSLVLEGVNFATNSDVLTPESSETLDKVATSLKDWPDVKVEIGGHTDARGSTAYNHNLSHKRAVAVKNYLVSKGVDASRLEVKGYGETKPIADNKTEAGMAKNRRVELTKLD